jgi:uncharacterized membrane protein YqjE
VSSRTPTGWLPTTFANREWGNTYCMSDATTRSPGTADPTLGALANDLSQQVPELIRSELRLAQAELAQKGKRVGTGVGMFGAAGVTALYGVAVLLATVVLALALVLPAWLAALIVTVSLFLIAGVLAILGKGQVKKGTPLKPERAAAGVKTDIATVKGAR